MLKFGLSKDIDLWPIFFPFEAGWAYLPEGVETVSGTPLENERRLLSGEVDIAMVGPLVYAQHQADLYLLPTPIRASELATEALGIVAKKRPDQLEQPQVVYAASSSTGYALLKILASRYYGFEPQFREVSSEAVALTSLSSNADICIVSGEAFMKTVPVALSRGYFQEDLTKAWWIATGLPLPLGLFALRRDWVAANKDEADGLIRKVLQSLRGAIQYSKEQMDTLVNLAAKQSGLEVDVLDSHYSQQRYELREPQLRGLFDFYRRATENNVAPQVKDLEFFPQLAGSNTLTSVKPASPTEILPKPKPANPRRSATSQRAEAQGLRVIKGGKTGKAKDKSKERRSNPENEN